MALLGERLPGLWELIAFGGEQIVYMHWRLVDDRASGHPVPIDRRFLQTYRYRPVVRAVTKVVAVLQQHDGIIGLAKLAGAVGNSFEDRSDIGGGGCDHTEDVTAAGLVSQRLHEIAHACLHLVEQPR